MKWKNFAVCVSFALFLGVGFLLSVFLPKETYSDSERRKLASMPPITTETLLNGRFMSSFETYTLDAFPFRDSFRTVKAMTSKYVFAQLDNNGVYLAGDYLSSMEYPRRDESLDRAARRFRYVWEKYLTEKNKVYLAVIPDKNCFMAAQSGRLSMDYPAFEAMMAEKMDFAENISIADLLELEDYYRTDTHWRQDKILDVARRLAQTMGTTLPEEYTAETLDGDFYGVYYGQAALPVRPDAIHYLTHPQQKDYKITDEQSKKPMPLYNMEKAHGKDPYEMFLSGPLPLVTIENPHGPKDKELIVFRDSFGSSIAPLLAGGYSKVTMVDIRYIMPDYLAKLVDFKNSDVLFLYSTLVLNNSETIK